MAIRPAANPPQEFSTTDTDLAGVAQGAIAASLSEAKTAETTEWSQKRESLVCVRASDQIPCLYLARAAALPAFLDPETDKQINSSCFCDHDGLSADFSDPENLDLAALRFEMDAIADSFGEACRRAMLGVINKLTFHWGECVGALLRDGRRWRVDRAIARREVKAKTVLQCAVTNIRDYLEEWWEVNVTRQTLTRWLKDCLEGLGLTQSFGVVAQGKKPRHWALNVPGLLLLAEALERRILGDARAAGADDEDAMDALPLHQGYTMVQLFNAIFPGFGWNRQGGKDEAEPTTYTESDRRSAYVSPALPPEMEAALDSLTAIARSFGTRGLLKHCKDLSRRWPEHRQRIERRMERLFRWAGAREVSA